MTRTLKILFLSLLLASSLAGCRKFDENYDTGKPYSRVLTTFYMGNNNLFPFMEVNIDSVQFNPLPVKQDTRVLLSYEHSDEAPPILVRVYSDWSGECQRDTLLTLPEKTITTDVTTLRYIFDYIKENFPSDHYGVLMSNHGTGWLPIGYYDDPAPVAMSFGAEYGNNDDIVELDIKDFAKALTLKTDYLILDACLMGGVETAYQLRNATEKLVFCSTEMMATGFPYESLVGYLLHDPDCDVAGYCEAFRDNLADKHSEGTVSVVLTSEMDNLAKVCATLFEKYREPMSALGQYDVQGFFRFGKKWFFDLEDMFVNAGISAEDKAALDEAIDRCVIYKYNTSTFLGINIDTFCGLSMYMPSVGNSYLNAYYIGLEWNKVTGLVK